MSDFIALKRIKFGKDYLNPGDPVPVEKGRNYHRMQAIGEIGPADAVKAATASKVAFVIPDASRRISGGDDPFPPTSGEGAPGADDPRRQLSEIAARNDDLRGKTKLELLTEAESLGIDTTDLKKMNKAAVVEAISAERQRQAAARAEEQRQLGQATPDFEVLTDDEIKAWYATHAGREMDGAQDRDSLIAKAKALAEAEAEAASKANEPTPAA